MKITDYLKLNVPELTDSPPDITKLSDNFPKIDANAKSIAEQINNLGANKADLIDGKVPTSQLPDIEVPVQSVNGKIGSVVLTKSDVGLGNVDNTSDSTKSVLSATKLSAPRSINGVAFDGTKNITVSDDTKAPTNHASTGTGYGVGTEAQYGHVALQSSLTQAAFQNGLALSGHLGKVLADKINVVETFTNNDKADKFKLVRTVTLVLNNRIVGGYSDQNPSGNPNFLIPPTEIINSDEVLFHLRGTITAKGYNGEQTKMGAYLYNHAYLALFDTSSTGYITQKTVADTLAINVVSKAYVTEVILTNGVMGKAIIDKTFQPASYLYLDNNLKLYIGPGVGLSTTSTSIVNGTLYLDIYTRRNR